MNLSNISNLRLDFSRKKLYTPCWGYQISGNHLQNIVDIQGVNEFKNFIKVKYPQDLSRRRLKPSISGQNFECHTFQITLGLSSTGAFSGKVHSEPMPHWLRFFGDKGAINQLRLGQTSKWKTKLNTKKLTYSTVWVKTSFSNCWILSTSWFSP